MIVPLDARDPVLLELQQKLLGVFQAFAIRTAPEGRSYRRDDPTLLERYDAAARALAADPPPDVEECLDGLRADFREADAAASAGAATNPRRSVTDLLDDPARRFGNLEAAERGTGLHRHLRDFFAEGGIRAGERERFEWHPLYGGATVEAEVFLERFGLTPLFVEQPLVAVAPDGEEIYGTADLIAANERRELVVDDWSASVARPEKLLQVAGYLALLGTMWMVHRGEAMPLGGGFVVGLGRDFDPGLLSCVRQVEPRHVRQFFELFQRDRVA